MNQNQCPTRRKPQRLKQIVCHSRKSIAIVFTASLLLSGAAGCTGAKHPTSSAGPASRISSPAQPSLDALVDPLSEITDKKDPNYIAASIQPILHAKGSGPSHYDLHINATTQSVRVYVVCAPDSPFTVIIGKRFAGQCMTKFAFFADIPVKASNRDATITVRDATPFILVVIPSPPNPHPTTS